MSMTVSPSAPKPTSVDYPRSWRWTCDEFHQIGDRGLFEGRNVILVDGEIFDMPVPDPPHDTSVGLADYKLKSIFTPGFVVRVNSGLVLDEATDAVPDLAVVIGSPRDYTSHPRTALLVVEVADSSLAYDRGTKACLYASGGIADYWVIDLVNRQLLVFRDPRPDATQPRGYAYQQQSAFGPADSVAPLAMPASLIKVSDLLP